MSLTRSLVAVATVSALLTGCTGQDDDEPVSEDRTPEEVMELAKETLDETSGVAIDLSGKLPSGVSGLSSATGVLTHDPQAFEGSAKVVAGFELEVKVIAVGDDVWIQLPGSDYAKTDPKAYGAPNPADLFAPDGGISKLLLETENLEAGDEVRGGDDNDEVFVEYSGTVPAGSVQDVIPSASGDDFDVVYTINADGELRAARITGEFYPSSDAMTYTIELDDYGTEKEIQAP